MDAVPVAVRVVAAAGVPMMAVKAMMTTMMTDAMPAAITVAIILVMVDTIRTKPVARPAASAIRRKVLWMVCILLMM